MSGGEVRIGGAWHTVARGEAFLGGSWRTFRKGEAYKGAAWRNLINLVPALSLDIAPGYATGVENDFRPVTVRSNFVTATPTGGASPYAYSWSAANVAISSPTTAGTQFTRQLGSGVSVSTTASCTVTDAHGATASDSIPVDLSNEG